LSQATGPSSTPGSLYARPAARKRHRADGNCSQSY
jgi:hypothetical protein